MFASFALSGLGRRHLTYSYNFSSMFASNKIKTNPHLHSTDFFPLLYIILYLCFLYWVNMCRSDTSYYGHPDILGKLSIIPYFIASSTLLSVIIQSEKRRRGSIRDPLTLEVVT